MDVISRLQRQFIDYASSLYLEGYVDDQFSQLEKLQDESNPDFLVQVVSIYFNDCQKLVQSMAQALEQQNVDFKLVDSHVHQLKGSSSSVGAVRLKNACIVFKTFCEAQNHEGCLRCLQQVNQEYSVLKNKLQQLFRLKQEIVAAGGSIPMIE